MAQASLAGSAIWVALSLNTALCAALNSATMQPIGVNAMSGLALGILSCGDGNGWITAWSQC